MPLTVLEAGLPNVPPALSNSSTYLVVDESFAYLGFVQEKVTTVLAESAATGIMLATELVSTGETPSRNTGRGSNLYKLSTLLQAATKDASEITAINNLKIFFILLVFIANYNFTTVYFPERKLSVIL